MGFGAQPMGAQLREHLGAPPDRGLLVTDVVDGGPASRAGLKVSDVIVAAGGTALRQPVDLVRIVGRADAGEKIDIGLFRDREERAVSVEAQGEPTPWVDPDHWVRRGLLDGVRELRRSIQGVERALQSFERELKQEQAMDPLEREGRFGLSSRPDGKGARP